MNDKLTKQKENISKTLNSLKVKIVHIEKDYGIDLSELTGKINNAIDNVNGNFFSIAFFGAFSDGKSTVLSVLTKNLDIRISPEPTTDKIKSYPFGGYQIIDTPGLLSEELVHDELTKKYISESNIVIFTVDPVNPLKESHESIVRWILKDLKKFNSTIMVVNKMDEVADLEDDIDYEKNSRIKKEVVSQTIKEITGIKESIRMVCIAADPYQKGLPFWIKREDEYRKLSRIELLENMISEFQSKYKDELIVKGGISVIRDVISRVITELDQIGDSFKKQKSILKSQVEEYSERVKTTESDISRSYSNIKKDFILLRDDLLVELDSVDEMSKLAEIVQKHLGDKGYILQEKIDLIIEKHTSNLLSGGKELFESLEESLVFHSKFQDELGATLSKTGKAVLTMLQHTPVKKMSVAIKRTRDLLKIPFKFKPYGAIKFAKFLKAMPVIVEVLQLGVSVWVKAKMDKKRKEMKVEIESSFKGLFEDFDKNSYVNNYFPFVKNAIEVLETLKESLNEIDESLISINDLKKQLDSIADE